MMIRDKIPEKNIPKLIIMYGSPASGKGFLTDHFLKTNDPVPNTSTIHIDIDKVISLLSSYQKEITSCKEYFSSLPSSHPIDQKFITLANEIYSKHRTTKDKNSFSPEDLTTQLISHAIKNKLNIIHETTGNTIEWLLDPLIKNARTAAYTIELIYLTAKTETIMDRLLSRARHLGRYPDPLYVKQTITNAQHNLPSLAPSVDHISIYENNLTPIKVKTLK